MHLLDIHSHILPAVDDGARDIETSIELLKMMKGQGITDVIATPHFDASVHNIDEFHSVVESAKGQLETAKLNLDLPNVFLGCEVYYFKGIGKSEGIKSLCIENTPYILLELYNAPIEDSVINDIKGLYDNLGLKPIIAHIERYTCEKGFKKLLGLIEYGTCFAQANTLSVVQPPYKRVVSKLIKKNYISFIATDTHSLKQRPPMMDKALEEIEKAFGKKTKNKFIQNSDYLYKRITQASL